MNPYFGYFILPSVPPPPPADPPPPIEAPADPVLDTPEEIDKWINCRKKNFPCKKNLVVKARQERIRIERGDISKFEIRMRKRLALMRKFYKREEDRKGRNPFLKYLSLRRKLLNKQILTEHGVLLQCIRYVTQHNFLQNS
jgi:hypothetical protein